jgi:hypothetical protein
MGPSGSGPGSSGCVPGSCVANPAIQTLNRLPTETSGPNLLITSYGMRKLGKLGLRAVPSAWLIQTRSQSPSLAELRNWATAAGILLALGVLAMTVGLPLAATIGGWLLAGREPPGAPRS